jgi:hypothetical protein
MLWCSLINSGWLRNTSEALSRLASYGVLEMRGDPSTAPTSEALSRLAVVQRHILISFG